MKHQKTWKTQETGILKFMKFMKFMNVWFNLMCDNDNFS